MVTPLAFIHSRIREGGIGIPCLSSSVRLAQKKRFEKLLNTGDTFCTSIKDQKSFGKIERQMNLPCHVAGVTVANKSEVHQVWAVQLGDSVEGRELTIGKVNEASHLWLHKPERVFPPLHLRGIPLRGYVLSTKARRSRGISGMTEDVICRGACSMREMLNNVLQVCDAQHQVCPSQQSYAPDRKNFKEDNIQYLDGTNNAYQEDFYQTGPGSRE